MSLRRTSFSSLDKDTRSKKFTPSVIHNKILININDLKEFFKTHTLGQCAKHFGCSAATIKRKLRRAGIDTSIHNHSKLAYKIQRTKSGAIEFSKKELHKLYIEQNLDSKTIAENYGVHYNTIRKRIREFGLVKPSKDVAQSMKTRHYKKHGYAHPAQRPDVMEKTRRSAQRVKYQAKSGIEYKFRSLHELSFALWLDSKGIEWVYEEMRIPYVDNMSGKWRVYVIDFTTINGNNVEWIEVKPNKNMIPLDKRIYASRRAEDAGVVYRGLTNEELVGGFDILRSGVYSDNIQFMFNTPHKNAKQVSYYFKSIDDLNKYIVSDGWKRHAVKRHSDCLLTLKLRRV